MTSKRVQQLGEMLQIAGREAERAREQGRQEDAAEWERRYTEALKELNNELNAKDRKVT